MTEAPKTCLLCGEPLKRRRAGRPRRFCQREECQRRRATERQRRRRRRIARQSHNRTDVAAEGARLKVAKAAATELTLRGAVHPRNVGLTLKEGLSIEAWALIGDQLVNLDNSATWWIADWLEQGHTVYGAIVNEVAEGLGFEPDTCLQYRRTAEMFPENRRRSKLSFSVHRVLATSRDLKTDEERDRWLERADDEKWSRQQLEEELREAKRAARTQTRRAGQR